MATKKKTEKTADDSSKNCEKEVPTIDAQNEDSTAVNGMTNSSENRVGAKDAEVPTVSAEPSSPAESPKHISKNQLKRQHKWAEAMARKKRKKGQEKAIKVAKAQAAGRDVEAERRVMEERRQEGSGRAKREQKWRDKFEQSNSKFQICLDCSFEDQMTWREINSLGSQIRFCYSHNKNAKHPVQVTATSLTGDTRKFLENTAGFDQWANRAFANTSQDIVKAFADDAKSKLVYLTSDSDNVLETLEDDKIYVIGAIVDRNRLKRAAIDRAQSLGIATAQLPIAEHFNLVATKVLTVNHVFELLVKIRENKNDWKNTLLAVLPERKDAKEKEKEGKDATGDGTDKVDASL